MIRIKIIALLLLLPFLIFSQDQKEGLGFLKKSIAIYKNAKAMNIKVDVSIVADNQELKEYGFSCSTLVDGDNRRLDIRNSILIELDSMRLFVDHNQAFIELQSRNPKTSIDEDVSQSWMKNMEDDLEKFINESQVEETEDWFKFSNTSDPEYAQTSYFFNKENYLLEKIIYEIDQKGVPYDKLILDYKTQFFEKPEMIDYGVEEFIDFEKDDVAVKSDYMTYKFFNHLKNQ